jgi:PmbA protein
VEEEANNMFGKLFELAKKRNIEQLEIYVYEKEELEIGLFHGEIDTYNVANLKTVSARGIYKGQMGYATSEKFAPGMEKAIVDSIIKNASMISSKEESVIYPVMNHMKKYVYIMKN